MYSFFNYRPNTTFSGVLLILFALTFSYNVQAQPSPQQLAEQLKEASAGYLSNIDRVAITVDMDYVGEQTSYYTKQMVNGYAVLLPDDEEDSEMVGFMSFGSEEVYTFIKGARSITSERLEGRSVYKVFVDDPAVFRQLEMDSDFTDEFEDDGEAEVKSATAWFGQDDLLVHKLTFDMSIDDGAIFSMHMYMEDYETFSGMPVAMNTRMEVEGLGAMISDDDMAEGMQAIEEMMRELENMPEAQREMIMRQMGPQIEQYKQMMEGDATTAMTMRITNVQVNP